MIGIKLHLDLKLVDLQPEPYDGCEYTFVLAGCDPEHNGGNCSIAIRLHLSELRMIHDKIHELLMENV